MATLSLDGIRKRFQGVDVLKGIDVACADGEFLVLVGPSGCGKSTLLNIIAGLEAPTAGAVLIDGRDVTGMHPRERNIAMVFQSYALYPTMTVRENIGFALEMRKVSRPARDAAVARVAELLQITHLLDRKPAKLSGGQRQRVAMGRALVRDPSLFLFDEPLSNLDAKLRVEMRTEIKKLHQRLGTSIVYVTHDQIEAMTLATRIAVMKDGIVQQLGTPQEIYDATANAFVAGFIGSPAMNFVTAVAHPLGSGLGLGFAGLTGASLPVPPRVAQQLRVGADVLVGIRPEHLAIAAPARGADASAGGPASDWSFEAPIEVVEPTGADTMVSVMLAGAEVTARLRPQDARPVGSILRLHVATAKLSFFDATSRTVL
jgi:multiple sugar transport system ATP-binding protein